MVYRFKDKFFKQAEQVSLEQLPIGVDTNLFSFYDKPITKQIIYVGRIHPHKNPSLLLQVFSKLHKLDPEYKLKIIGGFSDELYEEYFYDQLEKQDIKDSVEFVGKLTHQEMVQHLQQADFFLITSIIEGLSQASLEAMSCGVRPVIFDYFGAEYGYPKDCIYRTVDEAVEQILHPTISRQESRRLVEDAYDVIQCNQRVGDIIEEIIIDAKA